MSSVDKQAEFLHLIAQSEETLLQEAIGVATIPAPPFGEAARSKHIAKRFREVGLEDVTVDELGNVVGRRRGPGPRIMVVSHMDTVFPAGTALQPRIEGGSIYCPGIRDNSTAVANLISLVSLAGQAGWQASCDLILASSVGEEGLGDLRGMRRLMADWGGELDAVIAYDGDLGNVVYGGVGSERYRVTYRAAGGHSFAAFGNPSAIHGLATACARFCQIAVPSEPKSTFNIGTIQGGTSVNAIAEEAVALIDMRSVSQTELDKLSAQALRIFEETASEFDCRATLEKVGDRPAGSVPVEHPLVLAAAGVLEDMGLKARLSASSTDANIPLSLGIPAICIGSSLGHGVHTLGESMETASVVPGLQQLVRLLSRIDAAVARAPETMQPS
ncbi:M20/M25/M40 family metallo-hydrolase [Bosea caraganae]|uniref:M20/M25/M40 family metallo-hydrolase n=1 Tax=Bosea caraganae TaxID=2763117 RepID=A0A370KY51_9HYPH|nr:M20/M25/M40 family metallo-hydrolase [Bosea caraganae]RDJ19924.1 M20/M25/M40 family metallo-hydrolase [Bosea caraganae]RDJ23862.1 M20/M25/M40 family metallo-hydrolase [Bosea caraganae]